MGRLFSKGEKLSVIDRFLALTQLKAYKYDGR